MVFSIGGKKMYVIAFIHNLSLLCLPVDGILSALEDRCIITSSPVSVFSAAVLGDKLRSASLVLDGHLLTDAVRVLVYGYILNFI